MRFLGSKWPTNPFAARNDGPQTCNWIKGPYLKMKVREEEKGKERGRKEGRG